MSHVLYFYLFFIGVGVLILILSAFSLVSMSVKMTANCGLEFAMRLLLARLMLIASLSMASSSCVNMSGSFELRGGVPRLCVVSYGECSVKPERQDTGTFNPVSPARLDQPRYHYPRKIGRRPMGGLK